MSPSQMAEVFLWRAYRRADATAVVAFEGNRYQLPPEFARRRVEIRYHPLQLDQLRVWQQGRCVAQAEVLDLRHRMLRQVAEHHRLADPRAERVPYLELLVRQRERREQAALSPLRFAGEEVPRRAPCSPPVPTHALCPGVPPGWHLPLPGAPGGLPPAALRGRAPPGVARHRQGRRRQVHLRALASELDPTAYRVLYLADVAFTPRSFFTALLEGLQQEAPFHMARAKSLARQALLGSQTTHRRTPVLLVDEAQNLSPAVLEEIRGLRRPLRWC